MNFFPLKKFLKLNLDIFTFENQCHVVNQILNKNNLFLRIFEQKSKFRYITEAKTDKKNRIRFRLVLLKNITVLAL